MKKRKDGRYQKRVTLPGGKSKLLYGKTQKEVIAKSDRLKLDYALGKDLASGHLTLSEWLGTWWGSCKQGKTGYKSQKGYQNAVNRHIVPALGDMPLIAIKPAHVQDLINSMGKAGGWPPCGSSRRPLRPRSHPPSGGSSACHRRSTQKRRQCR